jgi:hypothetical protein
MFWKNKNRTIRWAFFPGYLKIFFKNAVQLRDEFFHAILKIFFKKGVRFRDAVFPVF